MFCLASPSSSGNVSDIIEGELGLAKGGEDLVAHGLKIGLRESKRLGLVDESQEFGELGLVDLAIARFVHEAR